MDTNYNIDNTVLFLKTDDNKIINQADIKWVKKMDECLEVYTIHSEPVFRRKDHASVEIPKPKIDHRWDATKGLDSNGTYSGFSLPPHQSCYIWGISWALVLPGSYAFYLGHSDISLIIFIGFANSVNYWRYPLKNSWRRYVDISHVLSSLCYLCFLSWSAENGIYFYLFSLIGCICYPLSTYCRLKYPRTSYHSIWLSTIFHMLVHVCANLANFALLLGKVA
jgi:hypothetical protein